MESVTALTGIKMVQNLWAEQRKRHPGKLDIMSELRLPWRGMCSSGVWLVGSPRRLPNHACAAVGFASASLGWADSVLQDTSL